MTGWFEREILGTGRLDLFVFFVAFLVGFGFIRFSVRMIRAQVRWWPGNVTPGGLHIHHVTFGLVFMLLGGIGGLAAPDAQRFWSGLLAGVFGIGTALVLDEFALVLHLEDVYWSEAGRQSVDAVFVAVAVIALLLLGVKPVFIDDVGVLGTAGLAVFLITVGLDVGLAVVTLAKGKLWTGLVGVFVPLLLVVGAIRLSRPAAPWARWFYGSRSGRAERALRREERVRAPLVRAKVRFQELIAGRPDPLPDAELEQPTVTPR